MKNNQILNNTTEEFNEDYKSPDEFKDSVYRGSEIVFEWKGIEYEIFRYNENKFWFGRQDNLVSDIYTFDELMKAEINGEKLIDICTKFTVIERTF